MQPMSRRCSRATALRWALGLAALCSVLAGWAAAAGAQEPVPGVPVYPHMRTLDVNPDDPAASFAGPWRFVVAFGLMAWVAHRRRALDPAPPPRWRTVLPLALMWAATLVYWRLAMDPAFFHQNGHGPPWILWDLRGQCRYGPGHPEVFGWIAHLLGDAPEAGVFGLQLMLGALWPVWMFLAARHLGAPALLALAMAVATAWDPLVGRIINSESYWALIISALLPALAALAMGVRADQPDRKAMIAGIVAAGLLVSQAARVHPIGWVACGMIPAGLLVSRGPFRRRLGYTALATAGVGLIAGAFAFTAFASIFGGSLTNQYSEGLSIPPEHAKHAVLMTLRDAWIPAVVFLVLGRRIERTLVGTVLFVVVLGIARVTNMIGESANPSILASYFHLFLPALAGVAAGACAPKRGLRGFDEVLYVGIAVAAVLWLTPQRERYLPLMTDQRESQVMAEWRHDIPDQAYMYFLGVAPLATTTTQHGPARILNLPIYGGPLESHPVAVFLRADDPTYLPEVDGAYYYRSSLCSTSDGQAFCEALEARLELEELHRATLPSLRSMGGMHYLGDGVEVALFRIAGRSNE